MVKASIGEALLSAMWNLPQVVSKPWWNECPYFLECTVINVPTIQQFCRLGVGRVAIQAAKRQGRTGQECVRVCLLVCVRLCVRACVRMCVRVCARASALAWEVGQVIREGEEVLKA